MKEANNSEASAVPVMIEGIAPNVDGKRNKTPREQVDKKKKGTVEHTQR